MPTNSDDEVPFSPVGSFAVRKADRGDAAAVGEIHAAAWAAGFAHLFDSDYLASETSRRRGMWAAMFDNPNMQRTTLLVAEDIGGQPVAFTHFGPVGIWNEDHQASPRDLGEIYAFYAHPSVWGKGASAMLMSSAQASLARLAFARVCLWTLEGAGRARRFYAKTGFRETGSAKLQDFGGGTHLREVEYLRSA
ncbi:GNAT family N-acetyltransferase [Actinopolymorpha alba]|uniref:GNAT family N-acetyltransferase n=1 Tax=Actinopolymorpha alba TaxID=533267 RepID=UPI00035D75B9|nr:GNAT family N-acetyltransferase [Actinopolymorpha alba]